MAKNDSSYATTQASQQKPQEGIWETVKVIVQALAIAFVIRTFLFQPFNIPSGSMYPTLKVGDYLFTSKLSYGYGKYSFNFAPSVFGVTLIKCCEFIDFPGRKILGDTPKRGDVAVFKYPNDLSQDYIKRVIGLPGDRVQMKDGMLSINGEPVRKERIEDYVDPSPHVDRQGQGIYPQFIETLPNGVSYQVLDTDPAGGLDTTPEMLVPDGQYLMMGDNRDNSSDSRVWGFVPLENFVGRADIIFFSLAPDTPIWQVWKWPVAIRWGRFFNLI
jgi:signal peptidase I